MEKSKNSLLLGIIALEALAIIVLGAFLVEGGGIMGMSADKAGQTAVDFINKNYGDGGTPASLVATQEVSGVFEVKIKFNDNDYTSYLTKDGKIFFTDGVNMQPAELKEFSKTDKPTVDLYVMSFCPFGNQAEETIAPVVDLLKDKINANLHYIFYSKYGPEDQASQYCYDKERNYCSMHGIQELNQNIREMCVAKYQSDKFWTFVKEINDEATSEDVDSKWEGIATKVGVDVQKIKNCYKNEALAMLKSETDLTAKKYPVQDPAQAKGEEETSISGSPTFLINGMIYSGNRTSEDIKLAVCSAFKNAPTECEQSITTEETTVDGSCN